MEEMGLKLLLETAGGAKVEETKGCWVVEKGWTLGTDVEGWKKGFLVN